MSLALLRDVVRAEVQNDRKLDRKSLRNLSETERKAVRAMRRGMQAATGANSKQASSPSDEAGWWI